MSKQDAPSDRTRLRRMSEKAAHDRATIDAILDACPVAHVGYVVEGAPVVTPTLQWREGDRVYWHGSAASRMLRALAGAPVCLTVTLTEGLVLARSGFEHSIAFRSAMLFGTAEVVADPEAKEAHLKAMMDQMFPGRWPQLRPMQAQELKATSILSMPIDEASAKIADPMPQDPQEDRTWPVWAGTIPLITSYGTPKAAPDSMPGAALPLVRFL